MALFMGNWCFVSPFFWSYNPRPPLYSFPRSTTSHLLTALFQPRLVEEVAVGATGRVVCRWWILPCLHIPLNMTGWKIVVFNRKYIFKWWIFHCHVSFRGGNLYVRSKLLILGMVIPPLVKYPKTIGMKAPICF